VLQQDTTGKNVMVEEAVSQLTDFGSEGARPTVQEEVERAASEFDRGTIKAYCAALVEHLEQAPDSLAELEALIVLGLAHPPMMSRYRIQIAQEGRRLAHLLEAAGMVDRAQEVLEIVSHEQPGNRRVDQDLASMMRRTGNVDRLVDRYVRRAEEAMADGRRRDAITWLREILLLDRSRSDIARMIRDLQYEEREIKLAWRRRLRIAGMLVVVAGLAAGVVFRELHIQSTYANLTPQMGNSRQDLQSRLNNLDSLINSNPLWLGMFQAGRERADLRKRIAELDAAAAQDALREADQRATRVLEAESARTKGLLLLEQRDFQGAAQEFAEALGVAPADWSERARVAADLEAISELTPEQVQRLRGDAR